MKLIENRIVNNHLHQDLLSITPHPDCDEGEFVAKIYLSEWFAEDDRNVAVYQFSISDVVDLFVDNYVCGNGKFDKEGSRKAKVIISDLNSMIKKLEVKL